MLQVRDWFPKLVTGLAILLVLLTFFAADSFPRLVKLKDNLKLQQDKNQKVGEYVKNLRTEVRMLQIDDRTLEKTARNERAMARPDELIFFFDKKDGI